MCFIYSWFFLTERGNLIFQIRIPWVKWHTHEDSQEVPVSLKEWLLVVTCLRLCSWRCRNCHRKASQLRQTGCCVLERRQLCRHPHGLCVRSCASSCLETRALAHVRRIGNSVLSSAASKVSHRKSHLLLPRSS